MSEKDLIINDSNFECEKCENHHLKIVIKKPLVFKCLNCGNLWKEDGAWIEE